MGYQVILKRLFEDKTDLMILGANQHDFFIKPGERCSTCQKEVCLGMYGLQFSLIIKTFDPL